MRPRPAVVACRASRPAGRLAGVETLITVLSLLGLGAAAWQVLRAAFRFLSGEASGIWASELADTHARRGDVTALREARDEAAAAARGRRRALAEGLGWGALLLAPSFTPWARPIYAGYALLWLIPWRRRSR